MTLLPSSGSLVSQAYNEPEVSDLPHNNANSADAKSSAVELAPL
jgi:hypothetical protein